MQRRAVFGLMAAGLVLAGCGHNKFLRYEGPEVTRIVVMKSQRRMYLMHDDTVLKAYDIDLGFAPVGPKQFEGDGRTPEGSFLIDRRNPDSEFHLSLGISYPTPEDVERAQALGMKAGGDIFIHGARNRDSRRGPDWTYGCIAVKDREVEQVYAMVRDGTQIDIHP
jgi:murein L,D-transpeptidase YafK